jgi:hypothetical protein
MQLIKNNTGHKAVQQEFNRGMSSHAPVSLFPLYQEGIKGCVSLFGKEGRGRFLDVIMRQSDINLTIISLRKKGLIIHLQISSGHQLSDIGFELVEFEMKKEKEKRASNPYLGLLGNASALSKPAIFSNYATPFIGATFLTGLTRKNDPYCNHQQ